MRFPTEPSAMSTRSNESVFGGWTGPLLACLLALSHRSGLGGHRYDEMKRKELTQEDRDWLAERFEGHRAHLRAVGYRMLGSLSEADDAVQEAWLRLSRSDTREIENLGGWLTTVVARVCLNMLQARKVRRGEPVGGPGPHPLVRRGEGTDPGQQARPAAPAGRAPPGGLAPRPPAGR